MSQNVIRFGNWFNKVNQEPLATPCWKEQDDLPLSEMVSKVPGTNKLEFLSVWFSVFLMWIDMVMVKLGK